MKRTWMGLAAAAMLAAGGTARAQMQETLWQADQIQYAQAVPGAKRAVLWGDSANGAFGGLVRFDPNVKHGLHRHTSDVKIVVIAGEFMYAHKGEAPKMYGAGSYLLIPGGLEHDSGSGAMGCQFFEEWSGKFDMIPSAPPAAPMNKKK